MESFLLNLSVFFVDDVQGFTDNRSARLCDLSLAIISCYFLEMGSRFLETSLLTAKEESAFSKLSDLASLIFRLT